jgi:nucleoside-diphosphate-sugar epimerase
MKIAITGSSGFIGKNLCNILSNDNIICIKRGEEYNIKNYKPSVICHLAANPLIKDSDYDSIQSNINLTARILDYIKDSEYKPHFIFLSSATVYGNNIDMANENFTLNPNSVYAATKIASEYLIKSYYNLGYINYTILRSVANVGKYCTHGVVKDIIYKLKNTDSKYLEILGNKPGSCKPYIFVLDTVRAIKHCIDNNIYGTYNLSTKNSINIEKVVEIIQDIIKIDKEHRWLGKRSLWEGDDRNVNIDNTSFINTGFSFLSPTSENAIISGVKQICHI